MSPRILNRLWVVVVFFATVLISVPVMAEPDGPRTKQTPRSTAGRGAPPKSASRQSVRPIVRSPRGTAPRSNSAKSTPSIRSAPRPARVSSGSARGAIRSTSSVPPRNATLRNPARPAPRVSTVRGPSAIKGNSQQIGSVNRPATPRTGNSTPSMSRTPLQRTPANSSPALRPQIARQPATGATMRPGQSFDRRGERPQAPSRATLNAIAAIGLGHAADRAIQHRHDQFDRRYHHGFGRIGYGYYGSCHRPVYVYSYPYFLPTYAYPYSASTYLTYFPDTVARYDDSSAYAYPNGALASYVNSPAGTSGEALSVPAPSDTEPTTYQLDPAVVEAVGEGNRAFAVGQYDDARQAYIRAVLLDGHDGTAKLLYGLASFAAGEFRVAATAVRRALIATPDLIDYPFNIVALYEDQAQFNQQLETLSRFVGTNPQDRDAVLLLGYLQYASGGAAEAQIIFAALADADPTDDLNAFLRDAATRAMQAGRTPSSPSPGPVPSPDEFIP